MAFKSIIIFLTEQTQIQAEKMLFTYISHVRKTLYSLLCKLFRNHRYTQINTNRELQSNSCLSKINASVLICVYLWINPLVNLIA